MEYTLKASMIEEFKYCIEWRYDLTKKETTLLQFDNKYLSIDNKKNVKKNSELWYFECLPKNQNKNNIFLIRNRYCKHNKLCTKYKKWKKWLLVD